MFKKGTGYSKACLVCLMLVLSFLFSLNDVSQIQYMLRKYLCSRKELVIQRLV